MASEHDSKGDAEKARATADDKKEKTSRRAAEPASDATSLKSVAPRESESPRKRRAPRKPAATKGDKADAPADSAPKPAAKPATARRSPAKRGAVKAAAAKPAATPGTRGRSTDTRVGARKVPGHAKPAAAASAPPAPPPAPEPAPSAAPQVPETAAAAPPAEALARMTDTMLANMQSAEGLVARLAAALASRRAPNPGVEAPGPGFFAETSQAWLRMLAEHPTRIIEQQAQFWTETLKHYAETQAALATGRLEAPHYPPSRDKRFSNPLWQTHPYFAFIRRQYEIAAETMRKASSDLAVDDPIHRQRIDWFTNQLIDMLAPTNFLATNPDALEKAVETEGESLVRGLQNLVEDVEKHGGDLVVTLADPDAFTIGENVATAPGEVVARRPLYELIQFSPSTEQAHAVPIILFPPWINKFYILDLKPQNSFIRWVVDQGFTLFVVSWRNPGPQDSDIGLDDYVSAYIDAMENVRVITGERQVNAVGYCIGGTTLSLTLALLKQRGQDGGVNSATFFTTLTDFGDLGEFTPFIQPDFVDGIEAEVKRSGILAAPLMARTFSFLRANDLVWGPAIRSYMLGEAPPAFDLLFWNGDATNLPGRMVMEYLRGLCQQNQLAEGGYEILGHKVRLSDITLPVCSITCQTDHIAPWKQCWKGFARLGSADRTFVVSESGHIAGIVNPPSKKKYGHYLSDAGFGGTPDDWMAAAQRRDGSWWPFWRDWIAPRSGPMVPARVPEGGLGPAPGDYVKQTAVLP